MAQEIILLLVTAGEFSIPWQGVLGLWWIKCHCDRFISDHFGTPVSVSFHQCSIVICILILVLDGQGWAKRGKFQDNFNNIIFNLITTLYILYTDVSRDSIP
jgi:fumarate reductase subunit C